MNAEETGLQFGKQHFAGGGETDAPACPMKQTDAQTGLQTPDRVAEGRPGNAAKRGGLSEPPRTRDRDESFKVGQIGPR
ncbi:UNVERIFIED_ORG: hypothetical protein GGE64_005507 [Rhizobium etli]